MPDVLVPVSLTSFAVRPRSVYRFYATARTDGSPLQTADVWRTLAQSGFGHDLQLWPNGQPSDWPGEDVPPLRAGQLALRGQGTYGGDKIATVMHLPSGPTLQIWSVWEHMDASSGQELRSSRGARSTSVGVVLLGLLGLAFAASTSSPRRRRRKGASS